MLIFNLSTVTLRELKKCPEPKKTQLIDCLDGIQFTTLDITEDVTGIANKVIHKTREYHYGLTKDMAVQEKNNFYK